MHTSLDCNYIFYTNCMLTSQFHLYFQTTSSFFSINCILLAYEVYFVQLIFFFFFFRISSNMQQCIGKNYIIFTVIVQSKKDIISCTYTKQSPARLDRTVSYLRTTQSARKDQESVISTKRKLPRHTIIGCQSQIQHRVLQT